MNPAKYQEYLKTDHWQNVKLRYYQSKLPKTCYICGTKEHRNLHHKSYKRIGNERLTDLIVLCEKHHHECHVLLKETRQGFNEYSKTRINLWNMAKKLKRKYSYAKYIANRKRVA